MLLIKLGIISYPWTQPFICCSESFRLRLCKHHICPLQSGSILSSIHRKQCGRWVDERNPKGLALPHSPCCSSGYHCHAFYPGIVSCLQFLVFSSIPRKGLIAPCQRCQYHPGTGISPLLGIWEASSIEPPPSAWGRDGDKWERQSSRSQAQVQGPSPALTVSVVLFHLLSQIRPFC